jgi:hypothetical protein
MVKNRLKLPPTVAAWAPTRHHLPAMHTPSRSNSKITPTMSIALITERAPASPNARVCPSVDSLMLSQRFDQQYRSNDLAGCDRRDQYRSDRSYSAPAMTPPPIAAAP